MIEGELRSETIEKFAELDLWYIPKEVFLALADLIDICEVDPTARVVLGAYIDVLLNYFPHIDGRNRDDIIRILHGHKPEYGKPRLPIAGDEYDYEEPKKKRGIKLF